MSGDDRESEDGSTDAEAVDATLAEVPEDLGRAKTFATPEPDDVEARAFAAQKRRLLAQMFGEGSAEDQDPGESALGQLGHYALLGEIGDGGMGRVYEAYDTSLDRKVAIKTLLELSNQSQLRARLVREAKAMARLTHPNVVRVYEIGESAAGPYIVMEFVEGQTLRAWLAARERSLDEILEVFRAAGRGLAAVHAAGLVHRDVKPDNVMIDGQGRVLVMDLGIVHGGSEPLVPELAPSDPAVPSLRTRTGAMLGTPYYMAPEQFDGQAITDRVDQYSFCVSLWEAVYGERPVQGESLAKLAAAVIAGDRREPARSGRAPDWLRAVLERGMAIEAEQRFESMGALVDALAERPTQPKSHLWVLATGGLCLLGLGLWLGPTLGVDSSVAADAPVALEVPDASADSSTQDDEAPRFGAELDVITDYELLPGGQGIVYVLDGALWTQGVEGSAPRKLHEGPVHEHRVTSKGEVYFTTSKVEERSFDFYYLPQLDGTPRKLLRAGWPYFCVLEDQAKIVAAAQNMPFVVIHTIEDDRLVVEAKLELEGEPGWIRELDCDETRGRVAILENERTRGTKVRLLDLDTGVETGGFELETPEVSSLRFGIEGDVLYYLIDRGRGFELEGRTLGSDRPRVFEALRDAGKETIAYALAPDGRVAYTERYAPVTQLARWSGGGEAPAASTWELEVPSIVVSVAISPNEQELALSEFAPGVEPSVSRVAVGSAEAPTRIRSISGLGGITWSPAGQKLAYLAEHHGDPRVWLMSADGLGPAPEVFESSLASTNLEIAWTPAEHIIYQKPSIQEYAVLDPESGRERMLYEQSELSPDRPSYSFHATPSPDGAWVALQWNREGVGLSLISVEHGSERILSEDRYAPIGWSPDGRYLYALPHHERYRVVRIPVEGGEPEPWLELEPGHHEVEGCIAVFANGDVLCTRARDERRLVLAAGLVDP